MTIAYVSGTRADFGLMTPVLQAIAASPKLRLNLYATGMHLMSEFGSTMNEVRSRFPGVQALDALIGADGRNGIAGFASDLSRRLIDAFSLDRPDAVLILGDRVEALATAMTCTYLGIPIVHLHGGERTGTVDDAARHAISRLAHVHLTATEDAAERLRKAGEEPWRIRVVGAPGLDAILNEPLPTREALLASLAMDSAEPFLLVTQHPVSERWAEAGQHMRETLEAVKATGMPTVIIYPNADAGGREMIREIDLECSNPRFRIRPSMTYSEFLALEREAAVWIGNSSAGMIESSSFKTPVVNIGERQAARLRAPNVIDVGYDREAIRQAIAFALEDTSFRTSLQTITNPWGDGKTGPRVAALLETIVWSPAFLAKRMMY